MTIGDTGDDVAKLQGNLNGLGFSLVIDGDYGPDTEAAVENFQDSKGLEVDGVAGHLTLKALEVALTIQTMSGAPTSVPTDPSAPITPVTAPSVGADVQGLDVSDYDVNSNWPEIFKAGYRFVSIKCTEGQRFVNKYYDKDIRAARTAGLIPGAYHFCHANIDARVQANFFFTQMGPFFASDLPPMIDFEQMNGVTREQALAWIKVFAGECMRRTNKMPLFYTDGDILSQLGHAPELGAYPLWFANPSKTEHAPPAPWKKITIWQKSWTGSIPGVHGAADVDQFAGSLEDLKIFARKTI